MGADDDQLVSNGISGWVERQENISADIVPKRKRGVWLPNNTSCCCLDG